MTEPQPAFIQGIPLAESFYREAVSPIIQSHFPDLQYTAALTGTGSEILGFDTEMSSDHHWGPRVMLFLRPEDVGMHAERLKTCLAIELPYTFRGYPTSFTEPDVNDNGTQRLCPTESGPVNHRVEMQTMDAFFRQYLSLEIRHALEPADWLTLPHQKLRTVCGGAVFRDDLGFDSIRRQFAWYPHDVWLYVLACGWKRISQDEHLMGRAGYLGDEIGSAVIGARLVRDIMRLAFLMEKEYPPYPKWFGIAFNRLKSAGELSPHLSRALRATSWPERESGLSPAYECIARMHNALQITDPLPANVSKFWGRPFDVIHGHSFTNALLNRIADPAMQLIAGKLPIGSIDLFCDNTDLLCDNSRRAAIKALNAPIVACG